MLKVEELTYNFISRFYDFEKDLVLTNYFHSDWEADIMVVNADGFSHEFEVKFSKSDFKNDFKKNYQHGVTKEKFLKHDKISCGDYICNQFSFLLPMGMIDADTIPDHCGIIEFYHNPDTWETTFYQVRKPLTVHREPFWNLVDKDMMMKMMARNFYFKKLELKGKYNELVLPAPMFTKK